MLVMDGDLIPLKRIAARLGVSRATFWRLSRADGFPPAARMLGRVYWRERDLADMEAMLDRFEGRGAFERARRHAKACKAAAKAKAAVAKKFGRLRTRTNTLAQPDLFGGPAAPAPGGAERLK